MPIFAIPSVLALSLKVLLLAANGSSFKNARTSVQAFFGSLLALNLVEIFYFFYANETHHMLLLRLYYLFALTSALSMAAYGMSAFQDLKWLTKSVVTICLVPTVLAIFIPNAGLAGVESIGYSITRIPGKYYFVIQFGLLSSVIFAFSALYATYKNAKEHTEQRRSLVFMLSIVPCIITALLVITMMQMGVRINGSVFMSLAVCVTLWALMYTEKKENVFHLLAKVPRSDEWKSMQELSRFFADPALGLKEAKRLLESEMVNRAMQVTGQNREKAAQLLGVSRQTLYRKQNNV